MYLLFDVGGTKTRLAISSDHQTVERVKIIDTPHNFDQAIASFKNLIGEFDAKFDAAAGGLPGILNQDRSSLIGSKNLADWVGKPFKESLSEMLHVPLFLENDAALGGLGEAVFGSGKGYPIVAYLTISTGVGGSRVVDGKIDARRWSFEPGKQIVEAGAGVAMTLEDIISGSALEKLAGKKPEEINDFQLWDEVVKNLSLGINNTIVYWSPDVVVLGGSITKSINIDNLIRSVNEQKKLSIDTPPIKLASLGEESGLYGALAYLNQKTKNAS